MDGRRPSAIMYVNTDVDQPWKQDEYHRWYRDVHFADVTEPGIFVHPEMFHNARSPTPAGEGKFLAFYESSWEDVPGAVAAFKRWVDLLFEEQRIHEGTVNRRFVILRQLGVHFATRRRRRSQSVIAVHVDAVSGRERELREWYLHTHVPETVELGICHTGSLNERIEPDAFAEVVQPDQSRFMALYESDFGDPVALAARMAAKLPPDRLPAFVQLRGASFFYRSGR
jgi:hypothetical protein